MTNFASAVLPFGIDHAVTPLTSLIDQGPMHIVTAWKESLNAAEIAIGTSYPNNYLMTEWDNTDYLIERGRDLPLSALIYELIHNETTYGKPKIHLVGHSYGAKLVALAGEEALRRWVLEDNLKEVTDQININSTEFSDCITNHSTHGRDTCDDKNECITRHIKHAKMLCAADYTALSGTVFGAFTKNIDIPDFDIHGFDIKLREKTNNQLNRLDDIVSNISNKQSIESMVLFNPALHPGEFSYPIFGLRFAPSNQLKLIPRKAIVYSKTDYANGLLFNLKEMVMSSQVSQGYQSLITAWLSNAEIEESWALPFIKPPILAVMGGLSTANSVVYGFGLYALSAAINTPFDWYYHVTHHNSFGWNPTEEQPFELSIKKIPVYLFNSLDFFIPLLPTEDGYPRPEQDYGFFRNSKTGLGKTGLNNLAIGRSCQYKLCPNQGFDYNLADFTHTDTNQGVASFNKLGSEVFTDSIYQGRPTGTENKIYSFDASEIYNTGDIPIVGSHGNLRSYDQPNECAYSVRYVNDASAVTELETALENSYALKKSECVILLSRIKNTSSKSEWWMTEFIKAKKQPRTKIEPTTDLFSALENGTFDKKKIMSLIEDDGTLHLQPQPEKREFTMNFLINFTKNNFIKILN